ncbi:MAG: tRNA epoxyqueuosine(34) reductase QueG [Armatimonadota bacterium]|nr:tRNA epoxyqueuosine(34) reductase QueG [Armatimonadota bacterium]MDR7450731.1 tRNA epoxyqueuosine(34) reductase QueG [Armatimonadota bacterium]MDR7466087.1 tRNA epoxyqueuosine(34) reductase QueG [Armatimonadota bacterium]MDR7493876.1 tRNA epoxyqueuosine(34) reductase QueG [Armatimonadota bacterium]MDR7498963.1 tRNA epoxyqueuosine(34) reductase QueG [Armatimonadota bacterium]
MDPMEATLTQEVKAYARGLGFDLVGVTTADRLEPHDRHLAAWVASGMHGTMRYMAEHAPRAAAPAEVVPGTRSAVVVGLAYRWDAPPPRDDRLRGRISAYAWGTDYHRVMEEKLRALAAFLRDRGAAVARYYADTGPLLDRALAQRAGLGWFGKNAMVITKAGFGSYVFLGEILTDLALAPDPPLEGSCGQCRICLDRCPTGAIVAPYVVDARRCISYLTIELRGWIPRELRPLLGTWVFGCDVCQDVCPHNALVARGLHASFAPRRDVAFPDLVELLHIDESTYQTRFRHSAIKRAKRRGLRRNAAVALGNLRDPRALPALGRALEDDDPMVRGHAAWALGRIGGNEAMEALLRRRAVETDPAVREEVEWALQEILVSESPSRSDRRGDRR